MAEPLPRKPDALEQEGGELRAHDTARLRSAAPPPQIPAHDLRWFLKIAGMRSLAATLLMALLLCNLAGTIQWFRSYYRIDIFDIQHEWYLGLRSGHGDLYVGWRGKVDQSLQPRGVITWYRDEPRLGGFAFGMGDMSIAGEESSSGLPPAMLPGEYVSVSYWFIVIVLLWLPSIAIFWGVLRKGRKRGPGRIWGRTEKLCGSRM
jgi:hypothetical protein